MSLRDHIDRWLFGPLVKVRRAARRAPAGTLVEVADGVVSRFTVRTRTAAPIVAPLSGKPCVYYAAWIDANRGSSTTPKYYTAGSIETRSVPFVITDGTAEADVECGPFALDHRPTFESTSTAKFDATFEQRSLFGRTVTEEPIWFGVTELRYREVAIMADVPFYFVGAGSREADPSAQTGGYRESTTTRLRFGGSERHPLIITDRAPSRT